MRTLALAGALLLDAFTAAAEDPPPPPAAPGAPYLDDKVRAASVGCLSCHTGIEDAHESKTVKVGCSDCHGGNAQASAPARAAKGSREYEKARAAAHVRPRDPNVWKSSANPVPPYGG